MAAAAAAALEAQTAAATAAREAKEAESRMWEECVDEGEAFVTAMLASVVRSLAEGPKTETELDQVGASNVVAAVALVCCCCCCRGGHDACLCTRAPSGHLVVELVLRSRVWMCRKQFEATVRVQGAAPSPL